MLWDVGDKAWWRGKFTCIPERNILESKHKHKLPHADNKSCRIQSITSHWVRGGFMEVPKTQTVFLSSTEAEYKALADSCKEGLWLCCLLAKFHVKRQSRVHSLAHQQWRGGSSSKEPRTPLENKIHTCSISLCARICCRGVYSCMNFRWIPQHSLTHLHPDTVYVAGLGWASHLDSFGTF